MIPDLYKDIKIQLYERATSPLLGSFVISWCLWNYKLLLVIFSSAKALDKIKHINEQLYPETWDALSFGIFYPLITTLAFIFLYPIPALKIFEHTRKQQAKLKEVQQKIEDETPLSQKEAREIRSNLRSLQRLHDEEISEKEKENADRDAAIKELNLSLDAAEKRFVELNEFSRAIEEKNKNKEQEILEINKHLKELGGKLNHTNGEPTTSKFGQQIQSLTNVIEKYLMI